MRKYKKHIHQEIVLFSNIDMGFHKDSVSTDHGVTGKKERKKKGTY